MTQEKCDGTCDTCECPPVTEETVHPGAPVLKEVPTGFVLLQRHNGHACYAACMDGGVFHGWLMWKAPNGNWVSQRKLAEWEIMQVEDQRDGSWVFSTNNVRAG